MDRGKQLGSPAIAGVDKNLLQKQELPRWEKPKKIIGCPGIQ
jgi:hypothetical protein